VVSRVPKGKVVGMKVLNVMLETLLQMLLNSPNSSSVCLSLKFSNISRSGE